MHACTEDAKVLCLYACYSTRHLSIWGKHVANLRPRFLSPYLLRSGARAARIGDGCGDFRVSRLTVFRTAPSCSGMSVSQVAGKASISLPDSLRTLKPKAWRTSPGHRFGAPNRPLSWMLSHLSPFQATMRFKDDVFWGPACGVCWTHRRLVHGPRLMHHVAGEALRKMAQFSPQHVARPPTLWLWSA